MNAQEAQNRLFLGFLAGLERRAAARKSPLDPTANVRTFVDYYGLTIDGSAYDWNLYGHLVEIYEDVHRTIVLQAGAQTGKSAHIMARILWGMIEHWGSLFGYYFPDYNLPRKFSNDRFAPFVRSNPTLGGWLGKDADEATGADNILTRQFGASSLYFLSTAGRSSTEGLPLRGVYFDEVRRMAYGDIQRAEERTSAQKSPIDVKVSTARYPDSDINAYFMKGDQRYFHTACACPDGIVLSLTFPNCVADLHGASPALRNKVAHAFSHAGQPYLGMDDEQRAQFGEAYYFCPECGEVLTNPRDGWWEPHNPGAWGHSYQMPQLLGHTYPAARALQKWNRQDSEPTDLQELHNSMLGLTFLDPKAQPVKPEHLAACVNPHIQWAVLAGEEWRRANLHNTAMGFDVQAGYLVAVIKMYADNGKHRTIHLEIVEGEDPWKEAAKLMYRFDVAACVCDAQPEYNEALKFVKMFEGRAWMAYYGENEKANMFNWRDRPDNPPDQKGAEEVKNKWTVILQRAKGLKWALMRWVDRQNECPQPDRLLQMLPKVKDRVVLSAGLRAGRREMVRICRELYWLHLQRVAFRKDFGASNTDGKKTKNEINDKYRIVAEHIGLDPHFAHADLYASAALTRVGHATRPRGLG